jgi:hypothetical protein
MRDVKGKFVAVNKKGKRWRVLSRRVLNRNIITARPRYDTSVDESGRT